MIKIIYWTNEWRKAPDVYFRTICLLAVLLYSTNCFAQNFYQIVLDQDNGWTEGGNWIDFDADGDLDLFLPNNRRSPNNNFLFRNDGADTFSRLVSGVIVTDVVMTESGTWGDYDNDGDIDLFVADGGFDTARNNSLYRNEGNGDFVEITTEPLSNELSYSTSSGWADYDNDGDLDLLCANLFQVNNPNAPAADFLYRNEGDGSFVKITSGVVATTPSRSFGIAWADYDNDSYVDLFVCHNSGTNILYNNNGDGTFTRRTSAEVGAIAADGFSLACSWGDYNNDGYQDLFVGNFGFDDYLYMNDGDGTFTKITSGPVVTNSAANAEGSAWGDYDNDGDLDLIVGNGGAGFGNNYFYENNGDGTFTAVTSGSLVQQSGCYVGTCWGDYDNDGDIDLFMGNFSGKKSFVYRNDQSENHWINITCIGTESNRSAIGAKVRVKANINGNPVWQLREISGQTGYNAQNSLRAAFGLRDATSVDSLRIEWPSGIIDIYENIPADQFITATENGALTSIDRQGGDVPEQMALYQNYPNPFNPETVISYQLSVVSRVELSIFNVLGQKVRTLMDGRQTAGRHRATWDGRDGAGRALGSGVYIYRLKVDGFSQTGKMVLVR